MRRLIILLLTGCVFSSCKNSTVSEKVDTVKTEEAVVEVIAGADLSTPLGAYTSCITALEYGDNATLSRCLSLPPGDKLDKRVALARSGYTFCGGYGREVLSATETPASGVISDSHGPVSAAPGVIWINYVKPHPPCQNSIGMFKVGNEWRLYKPDPTSVP